MNRVIVSGALANKLHHGGEAWVRLGWILGFRELGYEVHFIEQISRGTCVDAAGSRTDFAVSENRAWFERVTRAFGLSEAATLIYDDGAEFCGMDEAALRRFAAGTDLLVNISGHLTFAPVFEQVRRRAFVDIDPGFTQFWHAAGNAGARIAGHDVCFTIGQNIGTNDCPIPTCGIRWEKTLPPVALSCWPMAVQPRLDRFTTVASWRGPFGNVEFGGVTYGLKVHEFRKFLALPRLCRERFEVALNIHPADSRDLEALRANGWITVDPKVASAEAESFHAYVQESGAEFSVAQGIYVETQSGWFSDRTAHYLASGKPALVQDTGFSHHLPTGEGLLAFRTLEEAAAGAAEIAGDYERHSRAARQIAEQHFDARVLLRDFLKKTKMTP
jgi:hypothetical protein